MDYSAYDQVAGLGNNIANEAPEFEKNFISFSKQNLCDFWNVHLSIIWTVTSFQLRITLYAHNIIKSGVYMLVSSPF